MSYKLKTFAMLAVFVLPGLASALQLKEVQARYGPLGALRDDNKFLPGDYLYVTYYIDGISLDKKNGKATYEQAIELVDLGKNKVIFRKKTPNEVIPALGGERVPGVMQVIIGRNQAPGKYMARLFVTDKVSNTSTKYEYNFEIIAKKFGIINVAAQTIVFTGQVYAPGCALVNIPFAGKDEPNVDIQMLVLDGATKQVVHKPEPISLPKDLPKEFDWKKSNYVPLQFPVYLNRPGRFIIDIQVTVRGTNLRDGVRFPFTVVDPDVFNK